MCGANKANRNKQYSCLSVWYVLSVIVPYACDALFSMSCSHASLQQPLHSTATGIVQLNSVIGNLHTSAVLMTCTATAFPQYSRDCVIQTICDFSAADIFNGVRRARRGGSGGYQQAEKKLYEGTSLQAAWVDLRSFLKVGVS